MKPERWIAVQKQPHNTHGPWDIRHADATRSAAKLATVPANEGRDNAAIARKLAAVPDMLEAINFALPVLLDEAQRRGDNDQNYDHPVNPAIFFLRAALARVGGAA